MNKKTYMLRHPLNGVKSTALQKGYWRKNGRVVGLVLQFPCGHTASLTYAEIREARVWDDPEIAAIMQKYDDNKWRLRTRARLKNNG